MTPAEYSQRNNERARGKNPTLKPNQSRLAVYALGLAGETGEVVTAINKITWAENHELDEVRNELGDVLWYLERMTRAAHGATLDMLPSWPWVHATNLRLLEAKQLPRTVGVVCDLLTKHLFHDQQLHSHQLLAALDDVLISLIYLAHFHGRCSIADLMAINTAKLDARHPNGWDPSYHAKEPHNG